MICIGFAGEEAFDVILYMSRTLAKLNYEVLIIDVSASQAMCKSIHHGMELDSERDIVNYRGINYVRHMFTEEELVESNYRVVIITYGYNFSAQLLLPCSEMVVVLNTFPHVIDKINSMLMNINESICEPHLLIRDIVTVDDVERVKKAIRFRYKEEATNYLYLDFNDYQSAICCQITQIIQFTSISTGFKKYLAKKIHSLLPELKPYLITRAIKMAGRGR